MFHEDLLGTHLSHQRFDLIWAQSKLFEGLPNDLEYALCYNRVTRIIEQVASIIEDVHIFSQVFSLTIYVESAGISVLAEEADQEN